MQYNDIISAIVEACDTIVVDCTSDQDVDGRLQSAFKESEYLDKLIMHLSRHFPTLDIIRPRARHWYDISIGGIPINLKITNGGTDNAFNKTAIIYSITGTEVKENMNLNKMRHHLITIPWKSKRELQSEYHYLVLHKTTGQFIIKPIFDIHTFKPNPCNDLQINWTNEFKFDKYSIDDFSWRTKAIELLEVVQISTQRAIATMNEFAQMDMHEFSN